MDLNKKHLLYFITLLLLFPGMDMFGQSVAISGRILNQDSRKPVEYASVAIFREDSLFVKGAVTDSVGRFDLPDIEPDDYLLSVSCLGFDPKRVLIQNLMESTEIDILLKENIMLLDEAVVSASSTISKINQRVIFPTNLQLSHSANGLQLLNTMMLPGLNINPMLNTISSSDGGEVILQINGVNASSEEILTLRPHQIKRVEYSDYAGIRYGHASKIINYIVTRDDRGGVIGVDLMNSLNLFSGGDVFFVKLNRGKSEFLLNYVVAFQDFKNNNRTRIGSYQFDDPTPLFREEISDGGDYSYQMHDITLGFNYQQNDSVFFNANLKYGLTNHPHNDFKSKLKENGVGLGEIFDGTAQKINTPTVDLYYEHGLKRGQKVYVNVVGSYAKIESYRNYIEYNSMDTLFKERFALSSGKYSLIAEGIYEKRVGYGDIKVGAKHIRTSTKQEILQDNRFISELHHIESSLFAEWNRSKNNLSYSLGLRVNRLYLYNGSMAKSYYNLLPKAMVGYRLSENSFVRYDVEMNQSNPTLIELTDARIRLDPYLAEMGNLSLKPYRNLHNNLFYEGRMGLFTLNVNLRHHYKYNPIMESIRREGDVFLIIPENMRSWSRYNAEMTLRAGVIKNTLQLSFTGGFNHFDSRGESYSHTHSNFYYKADILLMYRKWMFIGQILSFDERLYGETVIKDGNYHYWAIQYNANNFSFGIGAFNPFKNISRTIMENKNAQAPFRRESFSDASQVVVVTLTWSLNFGKSHSSGSKSLNNQDMDYGIKSSYK